MENFHCKWMDGWTDGWIVEWMNLWTRKWISGLVNDLMNELKTDHDQRLMHKIWLTTNFWYVVERHSFADWLVCKKKSCSTSRQGNWLTSQEITRTRMVTFRNKISYISWRLLLLFQPNTGEALRQLLFNVDQIRLQLPNETLKFMDIVGTNCFHFKFGNLIALRLLD